MKFKDFLNESDDSSMNDDYEEVVHIYNLDDDAADDERFHSLLDEIKEKTDAVIKYAVANYKEPEGDRVILDKKSVRRVSGTIYERGDYIVAYDKRYRSLSIYKKL